MTQRKPEHQFELLAYADGMLDRDPAKKAEVEARLRDSPEDAALVHDYQAQTIALRELYGGRLADPVPERFHEILRSPPSAGRARAAMRAAAIVLLVVGAAMLGWIANDEREQDTVPMAEFLEQSRRDFLAGGRPSIDAAPHRQAHRLAGRRPGADPVSMIFDVPDVVAHGYVLSDRRAVSVDGDRMIRMTYRGPEGRGFALYIWPRGDQRVAETRIHRRGDVTQAFWADGPVVSALVAELPAGELRRLASVFRRSMREPVLLEPGDAIPQRPLTLQPDYAIGGPAVTGPSGPPRQHPMPPTVVTPN